MVSIYRVQRSRAPWTLVVAVTAVLGAAFARPLSAEFPVVHTVIAGDTSPAAQWGKHVVHVTMDTTNMFAAVSNNLPASQRELYPLSLEEDEWSSPENVLNQLKKISPKPNDTFLFYFSGHGGADDRGQYFQLAQGKLYREDVKQAMEKKGARLNVLLSDCCNVRGDGFAYFAPGIRTEPPNRPTPLFQSLFLKPSGWVDLNASSPGEAAFFRNLPDKGPDSFGTGELPGSLFTSELTEFFEERREFPLSWHDLVRELSVDVHLAFRANYPHGAAPAKGLATQTAQHVYAIAYPGMPDKSGPRTGLMVRDFEGKGAFITQIAADSPAARAYDVAHRRYAALRAGQIIVQANDTPVQSTAELRDVVAKSPQLLRILIRGSNSGASAEYLLTLRY